MAVRFGRLRRGLAFMLIAWTLVVAVGFARNAGSWGMLPIWLGGVLVILAFTGLRLARAATQR